MPQKYTLNAEQKERKALTDKILYANKKKAKKLAKIILEKPKIQSSDILINESDSESDNEEPQLIQQNLQQKYTFY